MVLSTIRVNLDLWTQLLRMIERDLDKLNDDFNWHFKKHTNQGSTQSVGTMGPALFYAQGSSVPVH
ncbi:MAG: hypothetical protein K6T88_10805 [Bacillus sp. (in: Bacteria)]|nr:hypothetical protein [Bacillus sp. (in: firmicutes)]